jgi:hypothetical protein
VNPKDGTVVLDVRGIDCKIKKFDGMKSLKVEIVPHIRSQQFRPLRPVRDLGPIVLRHPRHTKMQSFVRGAAFFLSIQQIQVSMPDIPKGCR